MKDLPGNFAAIRSCQKKFLVKDGMPAFLEKYPEGTPDGTPARPQREGGGMDCDFGFR
jgi:hypothetical protein